MKVGDLVHVPRYPYWGMGMVIENSATEVLVHWFDNNEPAWIVSKSLEKL